MNESPVYFSVQQANPRDPERQKRHRISSQLLAKADTIRRLYPNRRREDIVKETGYTWSTIQKLACYLGVKRRRRYRRIWWLMRIRFMGEEYVVQPPMCPKAKRDCLTCALEISFPCRKKQFVCPTCKQVFTPRRSQTRGKLRIYCSRSCFMKALYEQGKLQRDHNKLSQKACGFCGALFQPKLRKVLYCSTRCGGWARGKRVATVCGVCGTLFGAPLSAIKTGRGRLCSKRCRAIAGGRASKLLRKEKGNATGLQ